VPRLRGDIRQALAGFVALVDNLAAQRHAMTVEDVLDAVLEATSFRQHLERTDGDHAEVRWENVQELRSVAAQYEEVEPEASLASFLEEVALVSDVDDPGSDQPDAVTLITLHAAKGLEFPVVFMPGVEEGLLPHIRALDDPSQMEEERRVCYVGMTRAKQRLYLTRARRRFMFGDIRANPPSRFLGDIPEEVVISPMGAARADAPALDPRRIRAAIGSRSAPEPADESQEQEPVFRAGDRVVHDRFGRGIVVSCEVIPGDQQVTVAFEGQGVKRLLLSFAPLRAAS
jgi:DNA helicase II / ATP-dependent DNA helicase PcrA